MSIFEFQKKCLVLLKNECFMIPTFFFLICKFSELAIEFQTFRNFRAFDYFNFRDFEVISLSWYICRRLLGIDSG
jgi:hypothetical protein